MLSGKQVFSSVINAGCYRVNLKRTGLIIKRRTSAWFKTGLFSLLSIYGPLCVRISAETQPNRRVTLVEALRETLAHEPNIQIQQKQVRFARGVAQAAGGQFDVTLDTAFSRGVIHTPRSELERLDIAGKTNITDTVADVTNQRLGLSKQFRSGPSVTTGVELTRYENNLDQEPPLNRAYANIVFTIPLLRGFGAEATGAQERAAKIGHEAAALELQHTVASRLLATATAYWNVLAAERQLAIRLGTEARALELVERVRQLIAGKEVPAAELKQVQADYAEKSSARIAAEQQVEQARHALGLAMGAPAAELNVGTSASDEFPPPPSDSPLPRFEGQPMIERSLNRRADYQASLKTQQAARILETGARKNLKPQLDLNLEAGYTGLDEGGHFRKFYSSIDPRNTGGLNALGTVRFSFPFENNAARGLYAQRQALHEETAIRSGDLARNIASGIMLAFSDLDRTAQEHVKAAQAAALYREAVESEREKLRIGTSTIIDVIILGDRLSNALLSEIDSLARYASTIVRLRFETGLLISSSPGKEVTLSVDDFSTVPSPELLNSNLGTYDKPSR